MQRWTLRCGLSRLSAFQVSFFLVVFLGPKISDLVEDSGVFCLCDFVFWIVSIIEHLYAEIFSASGFGVIICFLILNVQRRTDPQV